MLFRALEKTYTIYVSKGRRTTRLHGFGWEYFVQHTNVHRGVVLLVFTIAGPNPRISVAFMEYANNEEHNEKDCESSAY